MKIRCIPTYHPAMILRQWEYRAAAVHDIRRAALYKRQPFPDPQWKFLVRPSIEQALAVLERLESLAEEKHRAAESLCQEEASSQSQEKIRAAEPSFEISVDIETRGGHIACIGLSWSLQDAICIPFMCVERKEGYWSEEEETIIVDRLRRLLTHPAVVVVGQYFLYDAQYLDRHWHFVPRQVKDTIIRFHTAYPGLPKKLDFQASLLNHYYRYWKEDRKDWAKGMGEEQLWAYNCEDCVRTQECLNEEEGIIQKMGLERVEAFQQAMFWPVLQAMQWGVRIDKQARAEMGMELLEEMAKREDYFKTVLGHPLNPRSPVQMKALFYDDLKQPIQRKMGKPTLDDDALERIAVRESLLRPLVRNIQEYRSLGVFLGTFIKAPLDLDDRMRCSYNISGAGTFRLSSSKSAFGVGANLQTIPQGTKAKEVEDLSLPNIRKMFIPDVGYTMFDGDLDRADLQVVVWESGEADLKRALRLGVDMHCYNAVEMFGIKGIPLEELSESHPRYEERREEIGYDKRQLMKMWVHGTDYGGSPRTMAINCGISIKESETFNKRWFTIHPGIKRWQERVEIELRTKRKVVNKFGYERFFFERVEGMLPEALAWIPQSTVAIVINKIWLAIFEWCKMNNRMDLIQILMQVHDSLVGQFLTNERETALKLIAAHSRIIVPYDDPLIIPFSTKTSTKSWGDCHASHRP